MKTPKQIEETIKAREAEKAGVVAAHNAMWEKGVAKLKALAEEHAAVQQQMQQDGGKNQLKITHLEGCLDELRALLPSPPTPKPDKKTKK